MAKTEEFQEFIRDIAMHIASMNPSWVSSDDIPEDVINREKDIYKGQVMEMGKKPDNIIEKIVEGKMGKFFSQSCLLNQPYVKDDSMTVQEYLKGKIAKLGENIVITRFYRLAMGEE